MAGFAAFSCPTNERSDFHLAANDFHPSRLVGRFRRFVYAFYHEVILFPAYFWAWPEMQILIGDHADGEIIAQTVARLGFGVVRGSSTRGGAKALREMIGRVDRGHLCVTPSGSWIGRLLPRRRPRANPRVVKRKYTRWHVKRSRHRHWSGLCGPGWTIDGVPNHGRIVGAKHSPRLGISAPQARRVGAWVSGTCRVDDGCRTRSSDGRRRNRDGKQCQSGSVSRIDTRSVAVRTFLDRVGTAGWFSLAVQCRSPATTSQ